MDSVCRDVVITAARGIYAGAKALSVMHSESSSLSQLGPVLVQLLLKLNRCDRGC